MTVKAQATGADVAIILGTNDVVNPAAHTKGSPMYGMPIEKVVEDMGKAIE